LIRLNSNSVLKATADGAFVMHYSVGDVNLSLPLLGVGLMALMLGISSMGMVVYCVCISADLARLAIC